MKNYNNFIENELNEMMNLNFKNILGKLKEKVSKRTIKVVLISLLAIYSVGEIKSMLDKPEIKEELNDENIDELMAELEVQKDLVKPEITPTTLINNLETNFEDTLLNSNYMDINDIKLSQEGWDMIRYEEGSIKEKGKPVLTAYAIGDGMITVGFGHAEKIANSKYKIGDEISTEEATKLFHKDVNRIANGVRRLFKRWKNKGIHIKLTQNQYDALISLTYNTGVGGMLKTEFIQHLKKGNYKTAADSLKTTKISSKFPGLKDRRQREYEKFIS